MPSVLHTLVIAAIFVSYMILMGGLIACACWPVREHRDGLPDTGDEEPELLPAAA